MHTELGALGQGHHIVVIVHHQGIPSGIAYQGVQYLVSAKNSRETGCPDGLVPSGCVNVTVFHQANHYIKCSAMRFISEETLLFSYKMP